MDLIWSLINLLMEFELFSMILTGLIGVIVGLIVYKAFMKLLSMFS